MGFQRKGESSQIYCRILLKDKLGFQIGKKEGDERKNEMYDVVSGEFVKIEEGKYKPEEGEERELVKIHLWDDKLGEIIISTARTSVARAIVNSLAGCKEIGMLELGLYSKVGKDGKEYPNVWVKNNKERPDWFVALDKQDQYIDITEFKGKKMRDYTKLEQLLKDQYENINKKSKYVPKEVKEEITDEPLPF